jgi:hypothetical protein
MKRSCERHTQAFDLPVRRMTSLVIGAQQDNLTPPDVLMRHALLSRASVAEQRRSAGLRAMEIPVRIRQTRTYRVRRESLTGFKCQVRSTRMSREPPRTASCAHSPRVVVE